MATNKRVSPQVTFTSELAESWIRGGATAGDILAAGIAYRALHGRMPPRDWALDANDRRSLAKMTRSACRRSVIAMEADVLASSAE